MPSKLYLLPGFGEDHRCYRNLEPLLRTDFDLIHVDYRPVLRRFNVWETRPGVMARHLIDHYRMDPADKLIGHSMGGYFGHAVSTLQGNPVAMIGSFSNTDKIVRMTKNKLVNYTMVGSGLIKTPLMNWYIKRRTNNKGNLEETLSIQENFKLFSNVDMLKMLTLSYGEDLPPAPVEPLRIHALDDTVVRTPDENFEAVSGGHFCLVFQPEEVYEKLVEWLHR
jgi:hypothetical protein